MEENITTENQAIEPQAATTWELQCAEDIIAATSLLATTVTADCVNDITAKYGIVISQEEIPMDDIEELHKFCCEFLTAALGDMLEMKSGSYFSNMRYYQKNNLKTDAEGNPLMIAKPELTAENNQKITELSAAMNPALLESINQVFSEEQETEAA